MRKILCAGVAVGKCTVKCATLGVGLSAPYITPAIDVACLRPCVKKEYNSCMNELASEISRLR